jgi:hypothetical protein
MSVPTLRVAALVAVGLCLGSSSAPGADEKPNRPAAISDLSMEITALQGLYQFDFKKEQLDALRNVARETSQPAGARLAPQCTEKFRQAMRDLHAELVKGEDGERVNDLQDKVENLRDAENPMLDDGWEITEEARAKSREVFRQLNARQIVTFLSGYAADFQDPHELVSDALKKVRGLKDQEWKEVRDSVAGEAGRLAAGVDEDKAEEISGKITQLLIEARGMSDAEFKTDLGNLEKSARRALGNLQSFDVIRNAIEYSLAELLSNPRLPAAIETLLKK